MWVAANRKVVLVDPKVVLRNQKAKSKAAVAKADSAILMAKADSAILLVGQ